MKSNIILIGYMGCGKSTVGRKLAEKLQLSLLDTDVWIEEKEGTTISKIFAEKGENYFRDLETECLRELLKEQELEIDFMSNTDMCAGEKCLNKYGRYVISVGGGLPVREENRKLLRQLGRVIYLKARPDTIYERIKGDTTRPLLQTENPLQRIKEMMISREEKYQEASHEVINVDEKNISEIIEAITGREKV